MRQRKIEKNVKKYIVQIEKKTNSSTNRTKLEAGMLWVFNVYKKTLKRAQYRKVVVYSKDENRVDIQKHNNNKHFKKKTYLNNRVTNE